MENNDPDKKLSNFLEEEKVFLEDLKKVDVENNWERFLHSTSQEHALDRNKHFIQRKHFFIRIAAAILLLLIAISTLYLTGNGPAHQIVRASTDSRQMELILSDGTSILLNEESTLSYPGKLKRGKREVSLAGEAYFQVERAEKSPFYIYIGKWNVKVVGTSFNVKEDASGKIEVGVVQGEVLFYEKGKLDRAISLTAGERCVYSPSTGQIQTTNSQSLNYLYWKTKKLTYRDESLSNVFNDLEILFKQKITISDPLILESRWNSIHENQDLHDILDELCLYFDLEYIQKDDTILVQSK